MIMWHLRKRKIRLSSRLSSQTSLIRFDYSEKFLLWYVTLAKILTKTSFCCQMITHLSFTRCHDVTFHHPRALTPPGYKQAWHVGVRQTSNKKLRAFITGVPARVRVKKKNILPMAEINFLWYRDILCFTGCRGNCFALLQRDMNQ